MMKKRCILVVGIFLIILSANAQHMTIRDRVKAVPQEAFVSENMFTAKAITSKNVAALGKYVRDFSLMEVDPNVLNRIANTKSPALQIDMPFNNRIIRLQLIKSTVVHEETLFFSTTMSGKTPVSYKKGAYYYGIIKDEPNTIVAISFFDTAIMGVISNDKGNHVLGKSNTRDTNSTEYIVYNERDLLIRDNSSCNTDDAMPNVFTPHIGDKAQRVARCGEGVGVYIETDHRVFINQGNDETNVLNFVSGLFNVTATLFQNEAINTYISEVVVWTVPDPYIDGNTTSESLEIFQNAMSGGFNGDLAHLFCARSLGGGEASAFAALCGSDDLKTAISADLTNATPEFPTYSWNAMVVTHEMGHSLGSRHTHACVWNGNDTAIDGCSGFVEGDCNLAGIPAEGGTIMSYCHFEAVGINFNQGFGPQPGDVIRNHVNSAPCIGCCPSDVVVSGVYSTPLTESSTWIASSGQTTILNTADVRFDADPIAGYIEFSPVAAEDFFLAAPVESGVFVMQALDGCEAATPLFANPSLSDSFVDDNNSIAKTVVPEGFALSQNVPNPFDKTTNIRATVPEHVKHAKIGIYTLQGVLVEEFPISKRGNVNVSISTKRLKLGIYIYALVADHRRIATKKMLVMP